MTVRLTVAQALVRFLAAQRTERDGVTRRLFAGCLGIFGHGNVAGVGQALLQAELDTPGALPYVLGRNEQAMVHTAVAYARQCDRLSTWAVTASIGPGATNMVTGAALATINRLPVLLLPSGAFAGRHASPLLQELEHPSAGDVDVNDCFRPVSRWFDTVRRPEQLPAALLAVTRVLTDPAETGAVTLCLPQDVQAQAHDWPDELFAERVWHVDRAVPAPAALDRAVALIRSARRPLLVAGGGVIYSDATDALARLCDATGIPVGCTQAGTGALPHGHASLLGGIGATGTAAANAIARDADVVIGVGTRWSDFTTASRSAFQAAGVRFVNVNVAAFDAAKHAGVAMVADARAALTALTDALAGHAVDQAYRDEARELVVRWDATVDAACGGGDGPIDQNQVIGLVNALSDPRDVVVCAAGSMPGDLHSMWRARDRKGYHVEYGYSCMGYEIAGGLGVRLADPTRDVFVLVGDGSYLMMATELATAAQEHVKLIVVLVVNDGFASIGALSESVGSQRFGTAYRARSESGRLDGDPLPIDLAANAASLGARVLHAGTAAELTTAVRAAKAADTTTVIAVRVDPLVGSPASQSWWDVPVAEVSTLDSTRAARAAYERDREAQRPHLGL